MASFRSVCALILRSRGINMTTMTPLLRNLPRLNPQQFNIQKRAFDYDSKLGPSQPFLERESLIFHPKNILKHYEVIPIILFTGIGFMIEVATWFAIAGSRHDVQWNKMPPACELVQTLNSPLYKPRIRKFAVYNQKYETPKGLLLALRGDDGYDTVSLKNLRTKVYNCNGKTID